ncbi:MAG: GerMN domain-containing protein [Fimbriimonas sp.]
MARKKSNSRGTKAVVVTMVVALVGVAAIAAYVQMTPGAGRVPDELRRQEPAVSRPGPTAEVKATPRHHRSEEAMLFVPALDGTDVKLGGQLSLVPNGMDQKTHLVTETFKSLGVPEGKALKCEVKSGVAIIDVNAAMVEHGYGSMEEGNMIKALQLALGQFPEVEKFQLMQDGQPIELGHLDLSEAVNVTRPGPAPEDKPNEG